MAITVGTITQSGSKTNVTGYTYSHTVAAGTSLLVVCVMNADAGAKSSISGVTWNGVAMTASHTEIYTGGLYGAAIYYMTNPAVGTYNVGVTVDTTTNGSASAAMNVSGMNTSDMEEGNNGNIGTGSPSITVAVATGSAIVVDAVASERTSDLTFGADQTVMYQVALAGDSNHRALCSYKIVSAPATVTMSETGAANHAHVVAAYNGATASNQGIVVA